MKEVSEFDLNKRLQERLAARIGGANIDSSAAPRFCMRVQAYRVFLRDYGHQKFALEVAARVQLLDSSSGRLLWEHNYVCGTNQSQVACNPSETEVASTVSPRRLEDFGGDAGAELIRNELQSAVNDSTKKIANRI